MQPPRKGVLTQTHSTVPCRSCTSYERRKAETGGSRASWPLATVSICTWWQRPTRTVEICLLVSSIAPTTFSNSSSFSNRSSPDKLPQPHREVEEDQS